jgi:LuxR family maltose regulon positive regulatory protein
MAEAPQLHNQILRTKLFVPTVPHAVIPRTRLTALLDTGLHRKLMLVSAPAGFGKTMLVAEWLRHVGVPIADGGLDGHEGNSLFHIQHPSVAWVSLDADDNQPVRF